MFDFLFNRMCKYHKTCPKYDKTSPTCTETKGMYYLPSRPGGCYIEMENKGEGERMTYFNKCSKCGKPILGDREFGCQCKMSENAH